MKSTLTDSFVELDEERPFSEELFVAIRDLLRWELRRRGAGRGLTPSFFGCSDWNFWEDLYVRGEPEEILASTGPLMDLAVDCYEYAVIRRYSSLSEQLEVKENIDGLIRLNIRNFVTERQRQNDPCGTRAYRNMRAGVEELVTHGDWQAEGLRRGAIYNDTCLLAPDSSKDEAASRRQLDEWLSTSAKALEVARQIGQSVNEELQARLVEVLRRQCLDHPCVYFGDLVSAWKGRARRAYEGIRYREDDQLAWSGDSEEDKGAMDVVRVDDRDFQLFEETVEVRSQLEALRQAVEASRFYRPVRDRLANILDELETTLLDEGKELPSQASMARRLDISTSTYHDDISRLRQLMPEINLDG